MSISKCFRQWHTDRLQVARELQQVSRRHKANSRQVGHKISLIYGHSLPEPHTKPSYAMVLARGHELLIKQVYLSAISLLQFAEFPCCLLALENINWPTATNWITVGCIVVVHVNRCLIEPRCLTKKTPGIRCLSHTDQHTSKEIQHSIA